MRPFRLTSRALAAVAVAAAALSLAGPAFADGGPGSSGPSGPPVEHVYEATNAAGANAIQVFDRNPDGSLRAGELVATGGRGAGTSLGSQGGVVRQGKVLLVVNGGDNTVSALRITNRGLEPRSVAPSGGTRPVSVTVHGDLVYVVNAGSDTISGLRLSEGGRLTPLPGSTRPLSATGAGPAQIQLTHDGEQLVVAEKATNRLVTWPVGDDGRPGAPTVTASAGTTPFGFDIDRRDRVYVSEAASGSSSSYQLGESGALRPISPVVPLNQAAPCWLVLTVDQRFAYVANAGSGSVSSYRVGRDGSLTLLAAAAGSPGAGPTDLARSADGGSLYVRIRNGDIASFAINGDGSLTALGTASGATAIGSSGLAAS